MYIFRFSRHCKVDDFPFTPSYKLSIGVRFGCNNNYFLKV